MIFTKLGEVEPCLKEPHQRFKIKQKKIKRNKFRMEINLMKMCLAKNDLNL